MHTAKDIVFPKVPKNDKVVAVFDVDGTVFRSSLLVEVVEACIARGLFPEMAREAYMHEYDAWKNRDGSYHEYIMAVVESFMTHIKGVYYGDFVECARMTVAEQQRRTYKYTRDLVRDLRKKDTFFLRFRIRRKRCSTCFAPILALIRCTA